MWDGLVNGEAPQGVSTYNVIFAFLLFPTEISGSPKTPNRPSMEIMTAEGLEFLIALMLIYVTTGLLLWTKFFAFPPPGGAQQSSILGGSVPRSNPLLFYIPFLTEKGAPFVYLPNKANYTP